MLFEALALVAVAAVQQPAQTKPVDQVIVTGERPDDKKKVCKQIEEIGSIIPKRDCRTKAEWTALNNQRKRNAQAYARAKSDGGTRSKWASSGEMGGE